MLTIAKIFGKSPFAPLQAHIAKVGACIEKMPSLLEAIASNKEEKVKSIAKIISTLEHEADLAKNDIRNKLPSTLFMTITRATLLEILGLQDSFADKAEDIATLTTLKPLENYSLLKEDFEEFYKKNIQTFYLISDVIHEFDTLLETSFGGVEAQKVKEMIKNLAKEEHELDIMQYDLMKRLSNENITTSYQGFFIWITLIKEVGNISNLSEKLGNRIRMILELK